MPKINGNPLKSNPHPNVAGIPTGWIGRPNDTEEHGRRPRGTVPPKFEVEGDGPCILPPNILGSSVCRMRANRVKKVSSRNYFLKNKGFSREEGSHTCSKDMKNLKNMVND